MTGRLDVLLTVAALAGWLNVRCARDTAWVAPPEGPYYRRDLALVHHLGFGFHARACAPGILALLDPVRSRNGLVLELGCGSGLLTRELTAAGHRVIATDASPAMLDLARSHAPAAEDIRPLILPGDVLPPAGAVVSATCSATCPTNTLIGYPELGPDLFPHIHEHAAADPAAPWA